MVFDEVRNEAYKKAIQASVKPEMVVLDLGAGLGIHGLLAAAAGAKRVILLEPSPVALLAEETARANQLSHLVEVVYSSLEDADNVQAVDVLISVFTGNFLLAEDLLPLLFLARDRFLKPGGVMLPSRARMQAALVSEQDFYEKHIARWSQAAMGLDFNSVRSYAANTIFYRSAEDTEAEFLSETVNLQELDFLSAVSAECRCAVEIPAIKTGVCHGLLGWFDMKLGDNWLSTGPDAAPTHWSLAFLPLDPPLEVETGDTVFVELNRPEFGEWTWTVAHGETRQRHSTFQSNPVDLKHMRKTSPESSPGLSEMGEMAALVLKKLADGNTVKEITKAVTKKFPVLAERDPQLEKRVRNLVAEWGGNSK